MSAVIESTADETVARIEAELADARKAEEAAGNAVGEAHLTGNAPQALRDALDAASRHRTTLEAALVAAKRRAQTASHDAGQARRRERIDRVKAVIDELEVALKEIDAGLAAFAASGAGPRAHRALMKLLPLVTDASESVLTDAGWVATLKLGHLRQQRTAMIDGIARESLGLAMCDRYEPGAVSLLAKVLRKCLIADLELQPANWATGA